MTLRMHRVSASRWEQLAASRRPVDLTAAEPVVPRAAKGRKMREEHAAIQAQVDAMSARRVTASR